jgi:SAM-dependent methyltransferase
MMPDKLFGCGAVDRLQPQVTDYNPFSILWITPLRIPNIQGIALRARTLIGLRPAVKLDERLGDMERVFLAPPLTDELVATIRLISPHHRLSTNDKDRALWEADNNGACWGEYEALASIFRSMKRPAKVLEIGCGLGRSLVFFNKKLHSEGCQFHAYEGEGRKTRYTTLGPRFEDSYCGNLSMLRYVLQYNAIQNVTIFNAKEVRLSELPGPYDFVYSFYGIGFHWALEHFLGDLLPLLHDRSLAVFTVPSRFAPFRALETLSYRLIDWKTAWPKDGQLKLLVLSKRQLPDGSSPVPDPWG